MLTTSRTLLERLRDAHDAHAWRLWVNVYEPWLRDWLSRQGLQAADADDVLQNVLVAVRQGLAAFDHNGRPGAFRAWLRTILVRQVRLFWRRRPRQAEPAPDWLEQLEDPASDLSVRWEQEHNQQLVRRVLGVIQKDFEPETWEVFRLLILDDLPAAEVARRTGRSENAVYVIKSRVLARLREELGGLVEP
jgi:RNA polymerase sigma-70 factor (ECF subfamily)